MTAPALAVDLGGTKVEAALVDASGAVVAGTRVRRPTGRGLDQAGLRAAVTAVVVEAAGKAEGGICGIGIGSAGPLDLAARTVSPVNMPAAHGIPLADIAAEAAADAGLPGAVVRIGHDGGCLALAEAWVGAARGCRASLSIVVSTGVGGGFVIDGRILEGASGNAGHLGQTRGGGGLTVEEVASGPASVAWARTQGWQGTRGEDLAESARAGDGIARAAIERSASAVGAALADAATLVDLDLIAIGGGFSRVSDDYVDLVQAAVRTSAVLPYARAVRVVRSALGSEGPLIGAAALVIPAREAARRGSA